MVVVWRVTERCNLSCKFCAYDRELSRPRREANPESIREFGAVLSEYHQMTGDSVLVSWLGGEPLLWQPLTELTRIFCSDYQLRVSTTTNGTRLSSAEVRAHLLEFYSELTISVDGIGSLHDELRGWPGGVARLERDVTKLANEKRVNGRGPILRANVLLMRETLPGFERLCVRLADWGIEEVTFNQLGGNDRPEFYPAHRLLPEQADWLVGDLPRLRNRLAAIGLGLRGSNKYANRIRATIYGQRISLAQPFQGCGPLPSQSQGSLGPSRTGQHSATLGFEAQSLWESQHEKHEFSELRDCHAGEKFLFINERAQIAPCSFTTSEYGIPTSELTTASALIELPTRFSELRKQRRVAACEDCHSTQVFEKFA